MGKKRRTRRQKQRAKHQFPIVVQSKKSTEQEIKPEKKMKKANSLFSYDVGLIRVDLTKTLILSILAVATIVVIYLLKII